MKNLLLALLFAASLAAAPGDRDGLFWQGLDYSQRMMWAGGWLDGLCTGETVTRDASFYHSEIFKFDGIMNGEIVAGLDQFYGHDYRNLPIWMPDAALLVARYSRAGMTSRECAAAIQMLREKYKAAP